MPSKSRSTLDVRNPAMSKGYDLQPSSNSKFVSNHSKATMAGNLKTHKISIHQGKNYTCNFCYFQATNPGNLNRHKLNVHKGIKYSCDLCEYQAPTRGSLKTHKYSVLGNVK